MSVQLLQGDCLELLPQIPAGSVDCVIADLPYGCLDAEWDSRIDAKKLFFQFKRICKQNANALLFCDMKFAHYLMDSTFPSEFSHCLIWAKSNLTHNKSAKHMPMSQYEMILVFRLNKYGNKKSHKAIRDYFMQELRESGYSIPQLEDLIPNRSAHHWFRYSSDFRIPTVRNYRRLQEITGRFAKPYEEIKSEFSREKNNLCTYRSGVLKSNLIYCPFKGKRVHETEKPVELLQKLILAYTNPGETVLDPTMGSGSTGVAAVNTGRNFIGIELDPGYFEIARGRVQEAQKNYDGT